MRIVGKYGSACLVIVRGALLAAALGAPCLAADHAYTFNSEPVGLINGGGVAAAGSTITTPTLQGEQSGRTFAYWRVNGQRQAAANGLAVPAAQFVLDGVTIATAVYITTTEDMDEDGLPDWWEWQQLGGLGQGANGDPDSDDFGNAQEQRRGWSSRLVDQVADGGIASRRSAKISIVGQNDAPYLFNSEPSGLVAQSGIAPLGTVITTPALGSEVSGRMFAYWRINGVRQAAANGLALPAATFALNGATTATAIYIATTEDSDSDGLPDWWEWRQFGNLNQSATGDSDDDGFTHAVEFQRGYPARIKDTLADGGVASRRSAKISIVASNDVAYAFTSEPAGIVNESGVAAIGTTIRTPALNGEVSGRMFAYWQVNGVRQAGAHGGSVPSATFTLNGATTATAVYVLTGEDADGDMLPDWWEWRHFGGLDRSATGDEDGDGFSQAAEFHRGSSPRLSDTVIDGGLAARRSVRLAYFAISASPVIVVQSVSQQVSAGGAVTLSVTAGGAGVLTYQWYKDGVAIVGATASTYPIATASTGTAAVYRVTVGNTAGEVSSEPMVLAVVPPGTAAAHVLNNVGETITITNTLTYSVAPVALDWQVLLPDGWRFVSDSGSVGQIRPTAGETELLSWEWTTIPPSPIVFSYTLGLQPSHRQAGNLAALANAQIAGPPIKLLAQPDPLRLWPTVNAHSVDANGDARVSLLELTRIIELYNTRHGTVRTGAYRLQDDSEDGFAPDPTRTPGSTATFIRYHSADTRGATMGSPRNAAIDLLELTRVIELYNVRTGTVRTGEYRRQDGSEDGFAPGP